MRDLTPSTTNSERVCNRRQTELEANQAKSYSGTTDLGRRVAALAWRLKSGAFVGREERWCELDSRG